MRTPGYNSSVSPPKKKLSIMLLLDLPFDPPEDQDYSDLINTPEFIHEADVFKACRKLGHDVRIFGFFDDMVERRDL